MNRNDGDELPSSLLPDFAIIGAMKAGTTYLHSVLLRTKEVSLSKIKEPNYFILQAKGGTWENGPSWYRDLFPDDPRLKGESSTSYSKFPAISGVPERIYATNPNAKLIYLVRDPVKRAISHYVHNVLKGTESLPIRDRLLDEGSIYFVCSRYALQLREYIRCFPREQILVIRAEELWRDANSVLPTVATFLGTTLSVRASQGGIPNETATKAAALLSADPDRITSMQMLLVSALKNLGLRTDSTRIAEFFGFTESDRLLLGSKFCADQEEFSELLSEGAVTV